jgi:hypothetical protein
MAGNVIGEGCNLTFEIEHLQQHSNASDDTGERISGCVINLHNGTGMSTGKPFTRFGGLIVEAAERNVEGAPHIIPGKACNQPIAVFNGPGAPLLSVLS